MVSKSSVLWMLVSMMATTPSRACPESCFCIDSFVTCSDFQYLDLTMLPPTTDTLVLTKGEVEEIPPGFLATASNLKMLEIISVNVRVVRGSAFRGLGNMDLFSITSSSFDIVEPDGFSGITEVSKFHISDSSFGRVGKHAFGYINNIADFRVWSSNFGAISEEAFYKLSDIGSFQFYHNNVTALGHNVFSGASRIGDININMNYIHVVFQGNFENLANAASRMVLHSNTFACSCDIAWLLDQPVLHEYLEFNHCRFPGRSGENEFRMNDISRDVMCPTVPIADNVDGTSYSSVATVNVADIVGVTSYSSIDIAVADSADDFNIVEEMIDLDDLHHYVMEPSNSSGLISPQVVSATETPPPIVYVSSVSSSPSSTSSASLPPVSLSLLSKLLLSSPSPSLIPSSSTITTPSQQSSNSKETSLPSSPTSTAASNEPSSSLLSHPSSSPTILSQPSPSSSSISQSSSSASLSPSITSSSLPSSSISLSSAQSSLSLSFSSSSSLSSSFPSVSSLPLSSSSSSQSSLPSKSSLIPPLSTHSSVQSSPLLTILLNQEFSSTNSNEEVYSSSSDDSSPQSSSTTSSQTTSSSQSNTELSTEDSSTITSFVSADSEKLFPDVEPPSDGKDNDETNDVIQLISLEDTPIHEVTAAALSVKQVNVHISSGLAGLTSDARLNGSAESVKMMPVVVKQNEHAVAYSTEAFAMATSYPDNSSHITLANFLCIVFMNGLCYLWTILIFK